ncbi:YceI family protein [Algimonas ampicilliniresistens]|nr:YceI family protein [Algimonas ampicilliniresistens]
MRFVILASCAAFVGLWACSPSASSPEASPVADVPAMKTNYDVIYSESRLGFTAEQEGAPFEGEFTEFTAAIFFDPAVLETARVRVDVPLASFSAGNADRESSAPGKAWFDMKSFPVAKFESDAIRADGAGYIADGKLSLKGKTLPLSLPFSLQEMDGKTEMRSTTVLDRTQWGVGEAPWDTDQYISRAVSLDITVVAQKRS